MQMTNFREKIVRWTPRWVMAAIMAYLLWAQGDLRVGIFVILVSIFIEMAAIRDIAIARSQDKADHELTYRYPGGHI